LVRSSDHLLVEHPWPPVLRLFRGLKKILDPLNGPHSLTPEEAITSIFDHNQVPILKKSAVTGYPGLLLPQHHPLGVSL
jgi:hypothetical protein